MLKLFVFLTHMLAYCVPTGVTNLEVIQSNVRRVIAEKFPLYCLGFGFDVNFEFLEKMALQNNGAARRIYEDSDADLQLKVFNNFCFFYIINNDLIVCFFYSYMYKIDHGWMGRG